MIFISVGCRRQLTAHQNRFDEPERFKVLPFVLGV